MFNASQLKIIETPNLSDFEKKKATVTNKSIFRLSKEDL